MKRYFYFYKITNNINSKFYYGVHSTNNLNDGYMGSGIALHKAINKYGVENFTKEIIQFFDDEVSMYEYEKDFVNEQLVKNTKCYNLTTGGGGGGKLGVVVTKDIDGNIFVVSVDDPRIKSGELVHNTKGKAVVIGDDGKPMSISINDPNYHKYKHINSGRTIVIGDDGKPMSISINDPNYHKYKHINSGKAVVKDKNGNTFSVSKNDPRIENGELVGITYGEMTVTDKKGNKIKVSKGDPRFKSGEICGYRKNMVTVKDSNGNIFSILKTDPKYISGEVIPLYKGCVWISKDGKTKHIPPEQLDKYVMEGWKKGRK